MSKADVLAKNIGLQFRLVGGAIACGIYLHSFAAGFAAWALLTTLEHEA